MSIENEELKIIPPADLSEFVKEGNELRHCVAAYVPRVLTGEEQVFVLRKVEESDTPFFTIEIKDSKITQVQGKSGCKPTEQAVIDFVKEFAKKNKLKYDLMV